MNSAERWEQCAPVSHEHDDRFDAPFGSQIHAFPNQRGKRKQAPRGVVYTQSELQAMALRILRAKNRKLHGKRGSGHVGLVDWQLVLTIKKNGTEGVRLTAEGFRHNLTGDRKLTASTAL